METKNFTDNEIDILHNLSNISNVSIDTKAQFQNREIDKEKLIDKCMEINIYLMNIYKRLLKLIP